MGKLVRVPGKDRRTLNRMLKQAERAAHKPDFDFTARLPKRQATRVMETRNAIERSKVKISPKTDQIKMPELLMRNAEASARPSGMGRGQGSLLYRGSTSAATMRHERAHLAPKRNTHTFKQRIKDPVRLGREEGRATYMGGEGDTYGRRFADPSKEKQFRQGFNEVYGRMQAKGTRIKKSAFGVIHTTGIEGR